MGDYFEYIDAYLRDLDTVSKNNANFVRSISTLEHVVSGAVSKDYLFERIYKGLPVKRLHTEGWIYHHQTYKLSAYCIGLSAKQLAFHGLRSNAPNDRKAKPPKRLDSLFMQAANLICLVAQEVSGATSLNDISTIAASYLYIEEKFEGRRYDLYQLKNIWQSFLYNINLPFRSGNSPFSNITLDFGKPPYNLRNEPVIYAGKPLEFTYSEIPPEYYDRINEAFIEAMAEGDGEGQPFTFPLITVNVDEEFDYSNRVWKKFLKLSQKFGGFYVQNYYREPFLNEEFRRKNPYIKPLDKGAIYSNCCRMMFDISKLEEFNMGSHVFGATSGVGGIGVIGINLERIIWLAQDNLELIFEALDYLLEISQKALQRKREWLSKYWNDLYPYLSFYQPSLRSLYNIFSVVGVHEGLRTIWEEGIYNPRAREFAHRIADFIYKKIEAMMNRDKVLCSLEYAPSENAAPNLAKKDIDFALKLAKSVERDDFSLGFIGDEFLRRWTLKALKLNREKLFKRVEVVSK